MTETQSQESKILRHLQKGQSLTAMDALKHFQCFRLASRICNLKKLGHPIKTTMVIVGKRKKSVAKYSLEKVAK